MRDVKSLFNVFFCSFVETKSNMFACSLHRTQEALKRTRGYKKGFTLTLLNLSWISHPSYVIELMKSTEW